MKVAHEPISTWEQYEAAAARMEQLVDAEPDTPEAEEPKRLTRLVVAYIARAVTATPERTEQT